MDGLRKKIEGKKSLQNAKNKEFSTLNWESVSRDTLNCDLLLDKKIQKNLSSLQRVKSPSNVGSGKDGNNQNFNKSGLKDHFVTTSLKNNDARKEKIEKIRVELDKEMLRECTFSPKIIGKRGVRSPEKYYKDQQGFEIKKFEKLKEKQKQQTESIMTQTSSYSFTPN